MDSGFIGIDPGISGAIALICPDNSLRVIDTPVVNTIRSQHDYIKAQMVQVLCDMIGMGSHGVAMVTLEAGLAMPGQSSVATFKTARGIGLWEGIVAALGLPIQTVRPVDWKRGLGIQPKSNKSASRVRAAELFPADAQLFARAKDDGRAEAALIAWYGRRLLLGR